MGDVAPSLEYLRRRRAQLAAHLHAIDCGDLSGDETLHRAVFKATLRELEARIASLKGTSQH